MTRTITVLDTGPQALVQDLGRPGNAHLGVPPSGALDVPALRLANRLVGNLESHAGIETLLGGLRLRAGDSCTIAVTGPAVDVTVDGRGVGSHVPVHLEPGSSLTIARPGLGLRCYVGISGGLELPLELGSRATDVLSGIGPAPLEAGAVLPLGDPVGVPVGADELAPEHPADRLTVPVLLGPRDDWFDDPADQLASTQWTVSPQSNRVGLRLTGSALRRCIDAELPSEGVVTGAVQVPADGRPVIFLADHPTTGGYPVIAVVLPEILPALGQARPGTRLRFRPVG